MPRVPGLICEVTLANFPPREAADTWRGSQIVHLAWTDGLAWRVEALASVQDGDSICVAESDLPACVPERTLPVFFLDQASRAGRHATLPMPRHLNSVPAWRANIRLRSRTTAASYQGEVPIEMALLETGSLLSIAPLIQEGAEISTKLVLVNLSVRPEVVAHSVDLFCVLTKRRLGTIEAFSNSCTVAALSAAPPPGRLVALSCAGMTGIPLYLSHDPEFAQLSLEHSHPLLETIAFGNRVLVSRSIKSAWRTRLAS